ncbi:efflux transporter outer membrane subunit [Acidisoma sp. S159]|uniref:efflux transporter outer membrane subunit n=1 Tax=Acidisoma sp. S159 TaxID=1747225 RepID=UPI00131B9AE1|nr:efflux transporter outer membrane subunit [Acidisoma sp. S159]
MASVSSIRHLPAFAMASVLASLLSGCEVGPDYHVPTTTLAAFHNADAVDGRQAPPAPPLDQWWKGFNDPELDRIEQRALAQNLDLSASPARVQQARAAAEAASAQLLPTADLNTQVSALHQSLESPLGELGQSLPGYNRDQRLYDVGAAASWEIDLFGGLRRGQEAARAEAQAAEAEGLGTRVSIAADAADAYFRVRGDQAQLDVARRQIDVDAHLLDLVQLQHTRGIATNREVAQAQALVLQARTTIPPLRIDLEAQLNRLDVLMGAQPGTYASKLSAVSAIAAIPGIPDADQPMDMLRRRPDVIVAERRVAAASARIGVAVSDYYPKISLSGALGFDSLSANHLFTGSAFQPIGTGALRWRIFDFGKVDAEVANVRGRDAEALAQYRQTVLHAAEDVENAFMELSQTELRTQELQDEVISLTHARDLSEESFSSGVIPLTDVLDADRQLLSAQDDLAQNCAAAARAAVHSFRALGGGWTAELSGLAA